MRTVKDVIKAISGLIETEFGKPPTTQDIREGFNRPCFFVEPYLMQSGKAGELRDDVFGIRIYYFSERSYTGSLDLLEKQTVLRDLLDGPIPVSEDFYLFPEDLNFELQREDMALICEFTLENVQLYEDTDADELMGDLSINLKKGE